MTDHLPFTPDWVSPPGDTISDLLEERGWSQKEFAVRTGFTAKHVTDLVHGRATITATTASKLSTTLGAPTQFWLTREAQYRAGVEHHRHLEELEGSVSWLSELPCAWMVKQRWIRKLTRNVEQVDECLRFFGVASVDAWRDQYAAPLAAFRASDKFGKKLGAVSAWLRRVELKATEIPCAPYDRDRFRSVFPELRALTTERTFVPRLESLGASCGVAVVFVPAPPGCPIHGVTRWLSPEKAMLGLSLRYKTNDQLWFSFFHEAAHIVLHAKKQQFIEGLNSLDPELEREADRFAGDLLIPPSAASTLSAMRTIAEVKAMATRLGVAPGILVGRMQKEQWIPWSHLNGLKVRYEWVDDED